eukprot:6273547-Alexandrium_andersonii.AAC.1
MCIRDRTPSTPTPRAWPRTPSTSTPSWLLPPSAVRGSGRARRGSRLGGPSVRVRRSLFGAWRGWARELP